MTLSFSGNSRSRMATVTSVDWDHVTGKPIDIDDAALAAAVAAAARAAALAVVIVVPDPVIVTAGPVVAGVSDQLIILNLSVGAAVSITLPSVSDRDPAGLPLEIIDFAGNAGEWTVTPAGAETIMGSTSPWTVSPAFGAQSGRALRLTPSIDLNGWTAR